MMMKYFGKTGWIIFIIFCMHLSGYAQFHTPNRNFEFRPGDWQGYTMGRYVTSIARGQTHIYFGTTGGILRYQSMGDYWERPFTVCDGLADNHILSVLYDFNTSMLWCTTQSGISGREPSSERWQNLSYTDMGIQGPVYMIGAGNTSLWVKTGDTIYKGDRYFGNFSQSSKSAAEADQARWNNDELWPSSQNLPDLFIEHGYFFKPEGKIIDPYIREYDITSALKDQHDRLWIGTWGMGPGLGNMQTIYYHFLPWGLYNSDVQVMAWDDAGMWIGGNGREDQTGITFWDMDKESWTYYESDLIMKLRSDIVRAIISLDDAVYFGTDDGLARLDRENRSWRIYGVGDGLYSDDVTSLALGNDALWIGGHLGISKFNLAGKVFNRISDIRLKHRFIYHLEADGDNLWAATDLGVYQFLSQQNEWIFHRGYDGMMTQEAYSISIYNDEVWIATDDGIEMYNQKTKEWTGYPQMHFDTGGITHNILADKKAVWIATENGVLKYNREENRWRRFTTEDGLLHNSVRWILLDGDDVWFGTAAGVTKFYWNAPYRID